MNMLLKRLTDVAAMFYPFWLLSLSEADQMLGFKRLGRYDNVAILPNVPILQPAVVYTTKVICAVECASNPDCSLLAFNTITSVCRLYPPAVYPADTFTLPETIPGEEYYTVSSDWCPVTMGFFLERETGLCFYVSEVKKNWANSIAACSDMGARLMYLEDRDRQNKIINMLQNDNSVKSEHIWIGGSDLNPGDSNYTFHWIDGSEVINTFWGGTQPNGQLYNEYCLGIKYAVLYDRVCSDDYRYYCDLPN